MIIKLPKEIANDPRYASVVEALSEVFLTPADLAQRWHVTTAHLGTQRRMRNGPAWVKIGGEGAVRYRLSDILAHERAGAGGPLSIDRLKAAVASLPDFSETQRAKILAHMLSELHPDPDQ
ncbi:hypothetical protein [Hyphomicrobium sp.]|uniref:hypothetical protein n=1 Tax=Hyphomicrobium sp. TaxID=82 RepID=UPI002C90D1A6|nr:hypothetical protein [Hyphomicrobium sp.]HRQ25651.1 hypothetical protein [Hyphomicrobium sp.]